MTFAGLLTPMAALGCFTPALRPRDQCLPAGIDYGAVAEPRQESGQSSGFDTPNGREFRPSGERALACKAPRGGSEPLQSIGALREPAEYTQAEGRIE